MEPETITILVKTIDIFICTGITLFLGDSFRRIYKCLFELKYYSKRYTAKDRIRTITSRAFSFSSKALAFNGIFVFVFCIRFAVRQEIPEILNYYWFLLGLPFYWLYHFIDYSHSTLSYAEIIRAPLGLDYGGGMALSYFYGYLKITMPSSTGNAGIRQRCEHYEAKQGVEFIVKRLVILIPSNLYTAPKIESRLLEKAASLDPIILNRAGVHRPYKNEVYRFTVPINKKKFYIVLEGATPLLSFYEAMKGERNWHMMEMQREILFKFYHHLNKLINENLETQQEVELVFYNAVTGDGSPQDVGEVLIAHFENLWSSKKNI